MTFFYFLQDVMIVISSLISVTSQCINKKQQVGFELGFKTDILFNVLHLLRVSHYFMVAFVEFGSAHHAIACFC